MRSVKVFIIAFVLLCPLMLLNTSFSQSDDHLIRADLEIPESLMSHIREQVGYENRPLGYSPEEMSNFPDHPYKLRKIVNLFSDITEIPRFSGMVADNFLENHMKPTEIIRSSFHLLDVYAGRGITSPSQDVWASSLIADDINSKDAFEYIIHDNSALNSAARESWDNLPEGYQRFVIRLVVASYEASPYVRLAFDEKFLRTCLNVDSSDDFTLTELYKLASSPWQYDGTPLNKNSFKLIDKTDLNLLKYGSILFFTYLSSAFDELEQWKHENPTDYEIPDLIIDSVVGTIQIIGSKHIDRAAKPIEKASFVIDIGSHTDYGGDFESGWSFANPITAIIDFAGNDKYGDSETVAGIGCGLFGISAIFDFDGDDIYECFESGIGCGWYGVGLVMDYRGNDQYITHNRWGQGAAHIGIGALIDVEGDDVYLYGSQSQGLGSTLGVGLLMDVSGDDKYMHTEAARKIAMETERSKEPPASLAQGCGYGRRADFGDGYSLAGGFGILVEGGGDDFYEGLGRFVQGTGYWWGMGILEDYGGDDTYIGYWYAQGASAHFGIGCHVDLEGNDTYNNEYVKSQVLGSARDGSLAVFIDGDGDDYYYVPNRSAGVGDLNGIGLFWDRAGNDYYKVQTCEVFRRTPVIGYATTQPDLQRTFRAVMSSIGIFLDTGGDDIYDDTLYVDQDVQGRELQAGNDKEWYHNDGPILWGWGMDTQLYTQGAQPR